MNNCIWYWIGGDCHCEEQGKTCIDINSDKGQELAAIWAEQVEAALAPLRTAFIEKYSEKEGERS